MTQPRTTRTGDSSNGAQPDRWRQYFETSHALQRRLERLMKEQTDLKLPDYNLCMLLESAEGHRLRLGDLARDLVFSPSRLTYQVGVLTERGLVRRIDDPHDGRVVHAELTPAGLEAFYRARTLHQGHVQTLFKSVVTEEEMDFLNEIFLKVQASLDEQAETGDSSAA